MAMKRFAVLIFIAILIMNCAVANAELDLHSMTNEELEALIEQAQNELNSRKAEEETSPVFFDEGGIKMYLSGEYKVQWAPMAKADILYLEYVIENNSTHEISISGKDGYVNGWSIEFVSFYSEPKPGKKGKDYMAIKLTPAGISKYEEIEEVEFDLNIYFDGHWMGDGDLKKTIKMDFKDGKIIFK